MAQEIIAVYSEADVRVGGKTVHPVKGQLPKSNLGGGGLFRQDRIRTVAEIKRVSPVPVYLTTNSAGSAASAN